MLRNASAAVLPDTTGARSRTESGRAMAHQRRRYGRSRTVHRNRHAASRTAAVETYAPDRRRCAVKPVGRWSWKRHGTRPFAPHSRTGEKGALHVYFDLVRRTLANKSGAGWVNVSPNPLQNSDV